MIENASARDHGANPGADQARVLGFLQELWPEGIPEDAEFVVFEASSRKWQRFRDLAAAAAVLAIGLFSYFSCALVRAGTPGRGKAVDAVAIPGVWFDLDLSSGKHSEKNLPTLEQALTFLARLPVVPSLILHSGGGLYAWWLLREPWILDTESERVRAENLVWGWQRFMIASAIEWGWKLDNTSPLSQILRAEGCLSTKYTPPRLVRCLQRNDLRWNPSDFEQWVPPPEPVRASRAQYEEGELPEIALREALACVSPDTDRYEWLLIGLALHSTGAGEAAFALWNDWSAGGTRRCGSSGAPVYPGRAALWKIWTKFGKRREGQKLVSLGTLVHRARANGWKGALPRPRSERAQEIEPLPPIEPTRPIVHDITEAAKVAREVAADWVPGTQSLHFDGAPGLGKTTAFGETALVRMARGDQGWTRTAVVLALPNRQLVHEKLVKLRQFAKDNGINIPVRELLGRSAEIDSGWYCERHDRVQQRAELHRPACLGCPLYGDGPKVKMPKHRGRCATERGRYWHARVHVLEDVALVVATFDALRSAWAEIPLDTPLILDDVGPMLGLAQPFELRMGDIESALENAELWRAGIAIDSAEPRQRDVNEQACEIVRAVLGALHMRGRLRSSKLEDAVRSLAPEIQRAVIEDTIKPPREGRRTLSWPWEETSENDGPDGRPAFTGVALDIAREVLVHNSGPFVERTDPKTRERGAPELCLHMPDRELIERAQAGFVAWLSVAPAPTVVLDQFGARCEVVRAAPHALRLIVGELRVPSQDGKHQRVVSFGPGKRKHELPSPEDEVVRAVAKGCAESCAANELALDGQPVESFAAVLLKADREALASPDWCKSFGAGHAGSDALEGAELLLVRRFVPPYATLAMDAAILRRMFGLEGDKTPPPPTKLVTRRERRRWIPDGDVLPTCVPADQLERELLRAAEAHGMANALGRSRALCADGRRVVLVLCGRPFDVGGKAPEVRQLVDVLASLGVLGRVALPTVDARRATLASLNAARADRRREQRQRLADELNRAPAASVQTLARRLKMTPRKARGLLAELRALDVAGLPRAFDRLRERLMRSGQNGATSDIDISIRRAADLATFPSTVEIAKEIEDATGRAHDLRTVRRHRSDLLQTLRAGAEILIPKRSDAAAGLHAVVRAATNLLAWRASSEAPGGGHA